MENNLSKVKDKEKQLKKKDKRAKIENNYK